MSKVLNAILLGAAIAVMAIVGADKAEATPIVVDVDAMISTGTTVNLEAGLYEVNFIGIQDGGAYNAWNAWGYGSTGCETLPGSCDRGYLNAVNITVNDVRNFFYIEAPIPRTDGPNAVEAIFSTDIESLNAYIENFNSIQLSILQDTAVQFWVYDSYYGDNTGGVSLQVTKVPEPSSLILLALGLIGLVWSRKRQAS